MENSMAGGNQVETVADDAATNSTDAQVNDTDAAPVDVWDEDYNVDDVDSDGSEDAQDEANPDAPEEVAATNPTDDDYKSQNDNADAKLDKPILIKLKGKVVEVSNVAEMRNLMELGLGATSKYREMAEGRKTLQFMEDNSIDMETLTGIVNNRGQEPVVPDVSYETDTQLESIATEIQNSNYIDTFREVATMLPADVTDAIRSNPQALQGFKNDISTGRLDSSKMHEIDKLVAIKGMNFQDAYVQVTTGSRTKQEENAAESRNTLTSQPKNTQVSSAPKSVWDMTDEEYDRYFNK